MTALITVNGLDVTSLLVTSGFQWEKNDIDSSDSGRDLAGNMRRRRIAVKEKITLTFRRLNAIQLKSLITAIKPETVSVTYNCPTTAANKTAMFYTSQIKAAIPMIIDGSVYYEGVSFNLIEV